MPQTDTAQAAGIRYAGWNHRRLRESIDRNVSSPAFTTGVLPASPTYIVPSATSVNVLVPGRRGGMMIVVMLRMTRWRTHVMAIVVVAIRLLREAEPWHHGSHHDCTSENDFRLHGSLR